MRIVNKTDWRTDHLRAIIQRVAKDESDPPRRKLLRVTIKFRRGRGCTGYAWINSNQFVLHLSRHAIDKPGLVMVIAHELAHCRGLRHRDMTRSPRYTSHAGKYREVYAWAKEMPLEKKIPKVKEKPGVLDKMAHAESKVAEWERRIKRSTTLLKKWRRRVRDLKRRMAALGRL